MNNLKRILSLALASVMLVGMMVVGASAAEFNDGADINNNDAVDTLVALNVIGGYDDGSFRPEGSVTRAQMAKMIAVAMNGGNEDFRGSSVGSQFTDVKDGMWYTKFINYCVSQGVINGRSATIFDPEGNVTATETAVMVMRAMGYRNETFLNEKGVYSPASVDALAESIGLYNDTTSLNDTSVALNRQNAAQVIYNGMQVATPEYTMTYNSEGVRTWSLKLDSNGQLTGKTMLEKNYKATISFAILDKSAYNAKTEEFTYTLKDDASIQADKFNDGKGGSVKTKQDVSDLYLQKVRVITSGNLVIGISAVGNNVLGTGVWGTRKDVAAKNDNPATFDGFEYDSKDVKLFNAGTTIASPKNYDTYTLIDNDGDTKIDAIVMNPVAVDTVNVVNKTQVTFGTNSTPAVKLEGNNVAEGLKKGEWVIVTTDAKGVKTVERMDVVENVTATIKDKNDNYTIGSESYKLINTTVELGKTYNISVLNGYVFGAVTPEGDTTTAGLNELVLAIAVGPVTAGTDALGGKDDNTVQKVQLMYANGTETAIKTVSTLGNSKTAADNKLVKDTHEVEEGKFYTYSENKDGTYTLVEANLGADWSGLKYIAASDAIKDGKNNTVRFNDDAVIFVINQYKNDEQQTVSQYKLFTGAEVNEWDETGFTGSLQTETQNGFPYAVVGALTIANGTKDKWPGAAVSSDKYGYLVADADRVYVADLKGTYTRLQIWTGTENVTRYIKEDAASFETTKTEYTAGTIVKYAEAADNTVALKDVTAVPAAVIAYAGGNDIQFKGDGLTGEYSLKDANVIYINDADAEGAEAASILLANEHATIEDELVRNVYVVAGTKSGSATQTPVLALFVDVNNEINDQPKAPVAHAHTYKAVDEVPATCAKDGVAAHYVCEGQNCTEAAGTKWTKSGETYTKATDADLKLAKEDADHGNISEVAATATACKHYKCDVCGQLFSDNAGTTEINAAPEHNWDYTYDIGSDPHTHSATCDGCTQTITNEACAGENDSATECAKCNNSLT